jgi:zinc transporter ZupT
MAILIRAASPVWKLIIICASILGGVLLVGGILLAVLSRSAETTIKLLGNELSSTSVGVALAFIGAVLIAVTLAGVLSSLNKVTGGNDGTSDAEARHRS